MKSSSSGNSRPIRNLSRGSRAKTRATARPARPKIRASRRATAPGNVDKKNLKKQGTWGNLQERQLKDAKNLLNREFPSNYHDAVEQYFKKLATRPSSK